LSASFDRINDVTWITLKTMPFRWEAELSQQLLESQGIAARLVDLGLSAYLGVGSLTALQVQAHSYQSALDLLTAFEVYSDSTSAGPESADSS
jgi:hypothetical protein